MDRYMPPDADGGAQHAVHTMTAKSPEQKAAGSLLAENPLPVPLSRFSFRHQSLAPRRQTPRCSHSVMDRFYGDEDDRCDFCHRQGAFGWLYRCNMDRDALIMAEKQKGHPVAFDAIGYLFSKVMSLGKHGPDARRKQYSFLNEITPEQMASYTPDQLADILEQRENVLITIKNDRKKFERDQKQSKRRFPDDKHPWVPNERYECQFMVCHHCYPIGKDKSWVSLDGVLNDDIMPSVATGAGFIKYGGRPFADAEIVREIGCRAVPTKRRPLSPSSNETYDDRIYDYFAETDQEAPTTGSSTDETYGEDDIASEKLEQLAGGRPLSPLAGVFDAEETREFKRMRVAEDLEEADEARRKWLWNDQRPSLPNDYDVRPPWTPPSTPIIKPQEPGDEFPALILDPESYHGRSPASLKTSKSVRGRAFARLTSHFNSYRANLSLDEQCRHYPVNYQSEEMYDVGLFLPFNPEVFTQACNTPLPTADADEDLFFSEGRTAMETIEEEACRFSAAPLDVPDGVALTEEAVETGTADIAMI